MADPYTLDLTCYDTDGSTVLNNVRVALLNVSTNDTASQITNSSGLAQFNIGNLSKGWNNGNEISLFISYGRYYKEHTFTIDTSTYPDGQAITLTLDTEFTTSLMYCTVSDIRAESKIEASELSNDAIHKMIVRATNKIDHDTGRTWKGVQTMTDEYYDGDDTDILWLNQTDIQSLTDLAIDDDRDGTYTDITITEDSVDNVHYYEEGYLVLDANHSPEVTTFISGPKTVKVSYTYGNSEPTEEVKELCILMVLNKIYYSVERQRQIDEIIEGLRYHMWRMA